MLHTLIYCNKMHKNIYRLLLLPLFMLLPALLHGQNSFISQEECREESGIADLNGCCGVLLLSKISNLVATVNEHPEAVVTNRGRRPDGLYAYEVVMTRGRAAEAKVEVSKRGDIDRSSFVAPLRADYFHAYTVDEVQKPIRMVNQTQATDVITDQELAEVEISSSVSDLQIECPKELKAQISSRVKDNDASITVTSIVFPVRALLDVKERMDSLQHKVDSLNALVNQQLMTPTMSETEVKTLVENQEKFAGMSEEAAALWAEITHIDLFAEGTNRLSIDISEARPRSKFCWGVLLREVQVPVTEFDAKVQEAGRLFALRDYDGARRNFEAALTMPDATEELFPSIRSSIADCDSVGYYHKLTGNALVRFKGAKTQEEMVDYGSAALEFLYICNRYNPCEFYESRIQKIEQRIEDVPLEVIFTVVERTEDFCGIVEGAPMPYVEIWADSNLKPLKIFDYSDRSFKKIVKDNPARFERLGTTNELGVAELKLNRERMPQAFIFHAVDNKKASFKYLTLKEFMSQSTGSYVKRRSRQGILVRR